MNLNNINKIKEKLFFVNKYCPIEPTNNKIIKKCTQIFYKDSYKYINNIKTKIDFPHLLIYGYPGSGKSTFAKYILKSIYNNDEIKVVNKIYTVNKKTSKAEFVIQEGNNHIEIDMRTNTKNDKYLIHEIISKYAENNPLTDKSFRVILIYGCELISHFSQAALRSIIELNSNAIRFIMVTNNIMKVITPIQSRLSLIKIVPPNINVLTKFLHKISIVEGP